MPKALLFDVGDVILEHNWKLLQLLGEKFGRDLGGRGPFDPESDSAWRRYCNDEITNDEYWDVTAKAAGYADRIVLWRAMTHELDTAVFATDSLELVEQAKAAGIPVGILSNDLMLSSGRVWVDTRPEFKLFDVLVDCTEFGQRKPASAPYLYAAGLLQHPPEDVVFLDDMPYCIEGASAVGMIGVLVDPCNRTPAFDRARELVGLPALQSAERPYPQSAEHS